MPFPNTNSPFLSGCLLLLGLLAAPVSAQSVAQVQPVTPEKPLSPFSTAHFRDLAVMDVEAEAAQRERWGTDYPWALATHAIKRAYLRDKKATTELRIKRLNWLLAHRQHMRSATRSRIERQLLKHAVRQNYLDDVKLLIDASVNPYQTHSRGGRTVLINAESPEVLAALLSKPPTSIEDEFALAYFMAGGDGSSVNFERLGILADLDLSYELPACGWAMATRRQFSAYLPRGETLKAILPTQLNFNPWSCEPLEYEYMVDRLLAAIIWYPDRRVAEWLLKTAPDQFLLDRSPNGSDIVAHPGGERADKLLSRRAESLISAAIAWPRPKVVEELLARGLDAFEPLANGRTAAGMALAAGEFELFQRMIKGRDSELHKLDRDQLLAAAIALDDERLLQKSHQNGINLYERLSLKGHPVCGSCQPMPASRSENDDSVQIKTSCIKHCEVAPLAFAIQLGAQQSLPVLLDHYRLALDGKAAMQLLKLAKNGDTAKTLQALLNPKSELNQQRFITAQPEAIDIERFRGLGLAMKDEALATLLTSDSMPSLLAKASDEQLATLFYRYALVFDKPWPNAEAAIAKHPDSAIAYASYVLKRGFPAAEPLFTSNRRYALAYAIQALKGRFPEGEAVIATDARASIKYARRILRSRFPAAEQTIAANSATAFEYAFYVLKDAFPAGEAAIATDASKAMQYASKVLEGPFPAGEALIAQDPNRAMRYASRILQGRFKQAEPLFAADAGLAYRYAIDVLGERFPTGEAAIGQDPKKAFNYALTFKQRFEAGEAAIASQGRYALNYARHVTKAPFPAGEAAIAKAGGQSAYQYAREILQAPFPAGEQAIVDSGPYFSWLYARHVLKDKFEVGHELLMKSSYAERYQRLIESNSRP